MEKKYQALKTALQEVYDIRGSSAVLYWDYATYMPPEGAEARGRQMATLQKIAHEKLTDPAIGRLLDDLQPYAEAHPYESDIASYCRIARREYEKASKVPSDLVQKIAEHSAEAYTTWAKARPANDFSLVVPILKKTIELSRQYADCFAPYTHIADPLIDLQDAGMKVATVQSLFAELRQELVPLVNQIGRQPSADDSFLKQFYPEEQQLAFGCEIAKQFGYDFQRGRQDKTLHPFMTTLALNDVRITTRVKTNDLSEALFSTLHESGHALYEQGIDKSFDASPLGTGTSAGVHESQSRLWENIVGRSRPFWAHYYPSLQQTFPDQLGNVDLDRFYRGINKVKPSLIRTDADEVTYNLHVMIRFDLELALLEGNLEVEQLPAAWNERYSADLGVSVPSDTDGVLQDVHWYDGTLGGTFQGYTLGNVMSGYFFDQAIKAHPVIMSEIGNGEFSTLHHWLKENIYQHGSKFTASELISRISGESLSIKPYMSYLRAKYGELYNF